MINLPCELKEHVKFVITRASNFSIDDIQPALAIIGYAAKECLRTTESVSGTGHVLGSAMILDVHLPLRSSNSSNVFKHRETFLSKVWDYLEEGVEHKSSGNFLVGFGEIVLSMVEPEPLREVTFTIQTSLSQDELEEKIKELGNVIQS